MSTRIEPRIAQREDAESIRPFGIEMKVMIAAALTGGTCSVLIGELKPGEGPPPHLHRDFDEYFFVFEGTISLVVDGKESTVAPAISFSLLAAQRIRSRTLARRPPGCLSGPSRAATSPISGPYTKWRLMAVSIQSGWPKSMSSSRPSSSAPNALARWGEL